MFFWGIVPWSITIVHHHLGRISSTFFQASWPCKSKFLIPEMEVTKEPWKGHFNIDPNQGRDLKKCLLEIMYLTFWVGIELGSHFHYTQKQGTKSWITRSGWWFQTFFLFIPTWGNEPIWLIFLKWVETTNQRCNLNIHKVWMFENYRVFFNSDFGGYSTNLWVGVTYYISKSAPGPRKKTTGMFIFSGGSGIFSE